MLSSSLVASAVEGGRCGCGLAGSSGQSQFFQNIPGVIHQLGPLLN